MGLLDISSWFKGRNELVYEQTYDKNNWMYVSDSESFSSSSDNLQFALEHPILTSALLFLANLTAQAKFEVINEETKEVKKNHPLTKLLNNPNYFQSRIDFVESLEFLKISQGKAVIWTKRIIGFDDIDSLYLLRDDLITYPQDFVTEMGFKSDYKNLEDKKIIYDKDGLNISIKFKDLLFIYDLPNVVNQKNMFVNGSRIDGLQQTLTNTNDSLIAKNIILKSNGKEMLSSAGGAAGTMMPFGEKEQNEAQLKFNVGFGLGKGRSRLFMTKSNVNWKSLHVALRDLGLDESTKVDANIIYTALHIPKDILSLEAKKTTYNNFKESMTSYIQNAIQSQANDICETFRSQLEEGEELRATYDHLPVMEFILKERYEAVALRAKALNDLLKTGVPDEIALDLCGFPKNLKLNERQDLTTQSAQTTNSGGNQEETGGEEEDN